MPYYRKYTSIMSLYG